VDWQEAEDHLTEVLEAYEGCIGLAGVAVGPALQYVIYPLRDRFQAGERTEKLHQEIMELKL